MPNLVLIALSVSKSLIGFLKHLKTLLLIRLCNH